MELNRKSLKKMFPNLAREVGSEENRVSVNSVRTDNEAGEKHATGEDSRTTCLTS